MGFFIKATQADEPDGQGAVLEPSGHLLEAVLPPIERVAARRILPMSADEAEELALPGVVERRDEVWASCVTREPVPAAFVPRCVIEKIAGDVLHSRFPLFLGPSSAPGWSGHRVRDAHS
jgi:hypothetical protein